VTSDADIAAAVRSLSPVAYRPGQGLQLRREAIASEAARTGLPAVRVAEIWARGYDVDTVLAHVRKLQAERAASGGGP